MIMNDQVFLSSEQGSLCTGGLWLSFEATGAHVGVERRGSGFGGYRWTVVLRILVVNDVCNRDLLRF